MKTSNTNLSNEKNMVKEAEKIVNKNLTHTQFQKIQNRKQKKNKKNKKNHQHRHNFKTSTTIQHDTRTQPNLVEQKNIPNSIKESKQLKNNSIPNAHYSQNKKINENTLTEKRNTSSYQPPHLQKGAEGNEYKKTQSKNKIREKKSNDKSHKKNKVVFLIVTFILITTIIILSFIFGLMASKSNKIISGISVNGINVSNLTKDAAEKKLNLQLAPNLDDEITLMHGDYTKTISPSTLNFEFNISETVNNAYSIGRSEGNIFSNNFKIISTYFGKQNLQASTKYNQEELNSIIDSINNELPDKMVPAGYQIEDNNLIITNGTSGYKVLSDELSNLILESIVTNVKTIEIPVEKVEADSIDVEKIYNEIHKEPTDATFSRDPYEIKKEEDGVDFAITLDEAKKIASGGEEQFTIPLKFTKPSVTVKGLPQEAFPDELGKYSTSYASSSSNRATNVELATASINGVVLMPGETFSYNETLGQRTPARGYKQAGVYVNGGVSTDYGGGICQVSSTLYNSVLLANLEVVSRTNHYFYPGYVPVSLDATVSWGAPDFQFKNNRDYPIRISAYTQNRNLTISIYGLKKSDDYEVKIQSYQTGTIPYTTEYEDDDSLPEGTTKVIQGGSNGFRSEAYKILYKNGTEVSRTLISSDTYYPHNQVVARGTAIQTTPEPIPDTSTPETPIDTPSQPSETNTNTGSNTYSDSSVDISF